MICFVTAFPAEARPLIQKYKFEQIQSSSLPIYQSKIGYLGISGMGKKSAAKTVSHLAGLCPADSIWVNVGIAGHQKAVVDTPFLAHKIVDFKTGKSWYPKILFKPACQTTTIFTVERCENEYAEDALYDMEASSFYGEVARFSTSELIHSFKVVSDNTTSPAGKISPELGESLIEKNIKILDSIVRQLMTIKNQLPVYELKLFECFLERWHFTVTESHQLNRLLNRLETLLPGHSRTLLSGIHGSPTKTFGDDKVKAKEVLKFLERQIEALPVCL